MTTPLIDSLTRQRFLKSEEFRGFCKMMPFFIARAHARYPDTLGDVGLSYAIDRDPGLIVSSAGEIQLDAWEDGIRDTRAKVQQGGFEAVLGSEAAQQTTRASLGETCFNVLQDVAKAHTMLLPLMEGDISQVQVMKVQVVKDFLKNNMSESSHFFASVYGKECARLCANKAAQGDVSQAAVLFFEGVSPLDGPAFAASLDAFVFDIAAQRPEWLETDRLLTSVRQDIAKALFANSSSRDTQKELAISVLSQGIPPEVVTIFSRDDLDGATAQAIGKPSQVRF